MNSHSREVRWALGSQTLASNQKCLCEKLPEGGVVFLDATFKEKKRKRERETNGKRKSSPFFNPVFFFFFVFFFSLPFETW